MRWGGIEDGELEVSEVVELRRIGRCGCVWVS